MANFNSDNVSIRLGNGDGIFSPATTPEVEVVNGPFSVAVGDFDNDGDLDLAVANFNSDNVSIRLGNGDGTFSPATTPEVAVDSQPRSVAVGNFN